MKHIITTALLLLTSAARSATWYVAPSGSDVAAGTSWVTAKQTIQAAIDVAAASDTVLVSNGVYETGGRVAPGSSLTNRVLIDKAITVRSVNGPAVTTIRGAKDPVTSSNGNAAVRCVWMTDGAALVGFTLTNGATRNQTASEGQGGGVRASEFSSAVVSNCVLTGNHAFDGGGAYGVTLNNCTLIGNKARFSGGGAMSGTANNCVLIGNAADAGGGALEAYLNNCTLTGNTAGSQGGGAVSCALMNCIAYHNTAPLYPNYDPNSECSYTCTTPLPGGTGNITNEPQFVNAGAGDVRLALGSPCFNRGNNSLVVGSTDLDGNPRISFGTVDMGAYELSPSMIPTGLTHYVALGNPTAAFPYTNWTTAAANIQDAIDTAVPGNTVLVSNGVYQTGGRVTPGSSLTNRVVIDKAITVQSVNGPSSTTIRGNGPTGDAAVRCVWMTNGAKLVGFTLANGSTRAFGSGDEFTQQNGGGAVGGTLDNCTLTGNSARHGGGAYGCIVNNSTLIGNSAGFSGGGARESTLNNCRVTGNSSGLDGGGVYNCTVNNGTVVGNSSSDEGGGAWGGALNNCIVYLNTAPNGPNYKNSIINYTCTTPLPGSGTGNIANDPQFVNAGAGNYRLLPTSPCRDAGSNGLVVGATDLDGNARISGAGVDMGAYEYALMIRYVNIANPNPVAPFTSWATAATNIQDAVDVSIPEDTVLVSNGVYQTGGRVTPGSSLTNRVVIDKAITMRSVNGPSVTMIRGAGPNGDAAVRCVWMTNGAALTGFTLTNGATRTTGDTVSEQSGGGLWAQSTNVLVNACIAVGNNAVNAAGVFRGTLNNCLLSRNTAQQYGGGTQDSRLNNCTVSGNTSSSGGAGTYNSVVNNSILYFNTAIAVPGVSDFLGGSIRYSCIPELPGPGSTTANGPGNITGDPVFVNAAAGDYRLLPASPCLNNGDHASAVGTTDLAGNTRVANGLVDMGAYELQLATRYVNVANSTPVSPYRNWATAASTIQDAIDASAPGDTVLVTNGVYATGGRVAAGSSLTNRVVIDEPILVQSVNGPAVTTIRGSGPGGDDAVRCVWMTNGATLVGFTLTNGATRASGDTITEQCGGGLWAQSTNAVISNCTLSGNSAKDAGGGAYQGTLNHCMLAGNSAGNQGGGAAGGGTLNHCLLTGNLAFFGGGSLGGTLNNCTLTGNSAFSIGGGASVGTLNNCIVYSNSASGGANYYNSTINYTCTTPLPGGGTGNITNDPQFVNAGAGNYRLLPTSPCRDAGSDGLVVGATDLDGNARIFGARVDMGAYEYAPSTRFVRLANPTPSAPYTSWATAATNIQDAVDASSPGDTVLVSNGVYTTGGRTASGSLLTNRVVIDKAITVRSVNGPAVTSIRGAWHPGTTNGDAAVRCVWTTNGPTLVGFTLTNGATRSIGDFVSERSGGGLLSTDNGSTIVSNCYVAGNAAAAGGGGVSGGTLNNCLIAGNHAGSGGGADSANLNNCTVAGNSTLNFGGGVNGCTLNNCVVFSNKASSLINYSSSTINYTCTTPLPGGTGNIDANPQFVNAAAGDYRLLASSPCINAGDNANAPGATDLDGSARIVGGTVDMGAFEYNQATASYDSDSDGFTDAEEYISDTQPANAASFFPEVLLTNAPAGQMSLLIDQASTGRVYGVYANTNLLQSPQAWTLVPPEQTGTAAALTLTITNSLPGANYRTGVRLP